MFVSVCVIVVLDIAMNGAGRRRGLKANHNTVEPVKDHRLLFSTLQ